MLGVFMRAGLLSAAILGAALPSIEPTRAQILTDREPNDTQANTGQIFPGQPLVVSGQLNSQDKNDLYALTTSGDIKSITIDTINNPGRVSFGVLEDSNNNGRRDFSDRVILLSSLGRNTQQRIDTRGAKRLLLQVFDNSLSSAAFYGFKITPSQQRSDSDVGILIRRAEAFPTAQFDPFSPGNSQDPDFYVKVNLDSRNLLTTKTVGNNRQPSFNHSNLRRIPGTQHEVRFEITAMDADPGRDDKADASPIRNERTYKVRYLTTTQEVIGPDNRVLGKVSSVGKSPVLGLFGDERSRSVKVEFQILHQGFVR